MKYLTIIRHAKSSWENPDLDDLVRPLNERGIHSIKTIGNYFKENRIQPDLVITSPATRALQTAIGIGYYLNYSSNDLLIKQEIYFGNTTSILGVLKKLDNDFNDVFLFGHEPILSSLIELFTKNRMDKFPTCAVYRIAFDINQWKEIKTGNLVFFITPKQLTV